MTIFIRIREKFRIRATEWLSSVVILTLSVWMVLFPQIMYLDSLSGFRLIAPPTFWSVAGIVVSTIRIAALILNGHYVRVSAPLRVVGSILGAAVYASLVCVYVISFSPVYMILPVLLVLLVTDVYNTVRGTADAFEGFTY